MPLPPSDEYELTETRAFDTYSGQEVLVRQVPLPEVVEAEVLDAEGLPDGFTARAPRDRAARGSVASRTSTRRPTDPAVRRAVEAAQAAARIPDHPRLDQVFDVFAEGGSLWIVSESVAARPLAALLAEKPLTPYRAAEVASDVLMALRVLHAHGWVHRNVTARTVLVCDDGRVMLTGLAVGAAEEALCGYDPVPAPESEWGVAGAGARGGEFGDGFGGRSGGATAAPGMGGAPGSGVALGSGPGPAPGSGAVDAEAARRAAIEARAAGGLPAPGADPASRAGGGASAELARGAPESGGDIRAARAGAIAAYRAGARAAARVQEAQQNGRAALPGARPASEGADGSAYAPGTSEERAPGTTPPGRIADPYGVGTRPWHGAAPRSTTGGTPPTDPNGQDPLGRTALPPSSNGAATPGHTAAPGADTTSASGLAGGPGLGSAPAAGLPGAPGLGAASASGLAGAPGLGGTSAPDSGATPSSGLPAGPGLGAASASGHPAPPGLGAAPPSGLPAPPGTPGTFTPGASVSTPLIPARWDDLAGVAASMGRGPATALAAERARQARMAVVGPVTERWAPEQAGPVHENWQLAAPIGPATDLWALGALLFRAVQGHAPYPEESTAELVQLVCAEPPAFAEECGPLRPVVESLLRQDPTERLDFEELRGWLRSLVRSAPEPEAGAHVVAVPPTDTSRLPVVRRRGELVRRRRAGLPAASAHGRHKRAREEVRSPRSLGRTLLLLILLALAAAIAYAMLFMPKADQDDTGDADRTGAAGQAGQAPSPSDRASSEPRPDQTSPAEHGSSPSAGSSGSTGTQTTGPEVADGFTLRDDPAGFRIAVANGWDRTPGNGRGQVVYSHGDFELIVVPGRDRADTNGSDPMVYQREKEPELQPYRDSSWATATGLKTIRVGGKTMAEGQFTWTDGDGRELFVRNLALLVGGEYHVIQVRGPEAERDEVTRLYEQASATYQITG
nr:protein kinase [Streptomyces sp. HUCO-GS316]